MLSQSTVKLLLETFQMTTTKADPKIIDLIRERKNNGETLTSLEYFPPRTEEGVKVIEMFCSFQVSQWFHLRVISSYGLYDYSHKIYLEL